MDRPGNASRTASRLDSLTGARFVAALAVFLFHASGMVPAVGPIGRVLSLVGGQGALGVQFFFVLSGFVLAWSWRDGRVRDFYRRRFARIAPAYWVALVLGVAWVMYLSHDPQRIVDALPATVGLQSWIPDPWVYFGGAGVEWSVSVELFFYALFPVLLRVAESRRGRHAMIGATIVLSGVVPIVVPLLLPPDVAGWAADIVPVSRLGECMAGLLLARAMRKGFVVRVRVRTAALVLAASYVLLSVGPAWLPARGIITLPVLLLIATLARADIEGVRTWLSRRAPVRLGEWSYCFYLVHQMTLQVVITAGLVLLPPPLVLPVWLVVSLVGATAIAALLHHLVERPFERRLRRPRARRALDRTVADPSLPAAG